MVIIGLSGSTDARRDAVAAVVADAKLARLVVHAIYTPKLSSHPNARECRARALDFSAKDVGRTRLDGVLFSQVRSEEEAERLRALGGYMWHVEGVPSKEVRIRRGDLLVTDVAGGVRHFLDPLEALSATLLAHAERAA